MKRRVLFGLMSSQQPDGTVSQLVDALDGRPVVVHHDFTKRADFRLPQSNVDMVPDPKVTGWGTWGFVDAVAHLMEHAVRRHEFDYFQLLSPTCLPIRPIDEFEGFVSTDPAEAHADLIDLRADEDALMHFGYRLYAPAGSLRFRTLRRVRTWYFGKDAEMVQTRSLSMQQRPARLEGAPTAASRAALALTRMAAAGGLGAVPFDARFRPTIGSTWFGARRSVCEYMIARIREPRIARYFSRLNLCDESVVGSVIGNSGFRIGPSNHAVSPFDLRGHPHWIADRELDRMFETGRFFARKFPEDPRSPVRLRALERASAPALTS
jgi:hypothetical protein